MNDNNLNDLKEEKNNKNPIVVEEIVHQGGKKELIYANASKKIFFPDGNVKTIDPNGNTLIEFTNGDKKEFFPSTGTSIYYYFDAQTKLTTLKNQTKIYEFPNGQIETNYPDGHTKIVFSDQIEKIIYPNGHEKSTFPDGTTMIEKPHEQIREVTLLNGKTIRYYPDGHMTWWTNKNPTPKPIQSDAHLKQLMSMTTMTTGEENKK
jgi:phage pi2 protein 07